MKLTEEYYLLINKCFSILQIFCVILYVLGSYFLTGNYLDCTRFLYFIMFCVMATICAQAWGFFIGATMPIKVNCR